MQHDANMPKKSMVAVTLNQIAFELLKNTSDSTQIPKSELVEDLIINHLPALKDRILKVKSLSE